MGPICHIFLNYKNELQKNKNKYGVVLMSSRPSPSLSIKHTTREGPRNLASWMRASEADLTEAAALLLGRRSMVAENDD
jgi:hypothetical protein